MELGGLFKYCVCVYADVHTDTVPPPPSLQVPWSLMREVVSEEEAAKLDNYALRSFVEDNPRLSWCVMDGWMDGWMGGWVDGWMCIAHAGLHWPVCTCARKR
jgi:hypothetical protein